jgi:ABC-type uncharacterized transport system auxiliary subunit
VIRLLVPCLLLGGCLLDRPAGTPVHLVDPRPPAPAPAVPLTDALPVRVVPTAARGHIDGRILVRRGDGGLARLDDLRWSAPPDRHLDAAWRVAVEAEPRLRAVDSDGVATAALELTVCELVSSGRELRLAVSLTVVRADGQVAIRPLQATAPVAGESAGPLAEAAGKAMAQLAGEAAVKTAELLR